MLARRSFLVLVLVTGAASAVLGCDLVKVLKPADVSFGIDKEELRVGEDLEVTFSILNRDGGRRYWVTLLPEAAGFDDPTGEVEVPEGSTSVRVSATAPGPHSVRVLSDRGGAKRMVAWRRVNVVP